MINIGQYIETAINWLTNHFATFFDTLSIGIGGFIDSFQHVLYGIPFYITIIALTVLAWIKSGKGTAVFTILGLLLIYGMGFWEETMQTLALVLSSTCLALLLGVPLGIWTANSNRCNKIMRPILDFMQTMPAFVYLIPAVLFFGLGTVPGAFATVIFGEGVTEEQAAEVENLLHKENKEMEINVINGGQPVYYYIISVE